MKQGILPFAVPVKRIMLIPMPMGLVILTIPCLHAVNQRDM